jgi:hypothetical protein
VIGRSPTSRGLIVIALVAAAGCATAAPPQMNVITATNIFFQPEDKGGRHRSLRPAHGLSVTSS